MSSKTLLFADDSATMRLIMEKTFQGEDFQVVSVPSGQAAIEKAKELTPDIIIADAGMTGVNGYDVCEAIRNSRTPQTPVIIMSGISSPYDDVRGKNVAVTEHIKKPFDTTKLIDKVIELCSSAKPVISIAPNGPGVAPARPNLSMPPVRKAEVKDSPSLGSTLHSFSRPGIDRPQSVQPVSAPGTAKKDPFVTTHTISSPASEPVRISKPPREPEPIELSDPENSNEIQVGTLAELAQMNELGGKVPQEKREDAIDIDESTDEIQEAPLPLSNAPKSGMASAIQNAASKAAMEMVQSVGGLTSAQAQAIMTLTEDVVEKIVWEVVPDLAEAIIREKIDELLKE